MVAGSIPVRRSWTSLPGGLFLHHFEGGRLPLAPAALSAKHSGCHPREGGDLFCASKPSSATPSAGSTPQRPRPRSTNRCHARLRAGTSSFSSKRMVQQIVILTIADCHADENQHRMFFEKYVCFEWHFARSYRPLVRWLVKNLRFLTRSPQHGTLAQCRFWLTTITSFECSLCETPPLRKETRDGLC